MPDSNPYLSYFVDPAYSEDYGVQPPRHRLLLMGAAAAGSLLFLRSSAGRRALSRLAPKPAVASTLLERRYLDMRYAAHEMATVVGERLADLGPKRRRQVFASHLARMEREFAAEAVQKQSLLGSILGLKPVTVGDVLQGRVSHEFQPFSILQRRTQEQLMQGMPPYMLKDAPPELMRSWLSAQARRTPDLLQAPLDPLLFSLGDGQTLDLRGLRDISDRFVDALSHISIPIVGWSPAQILRMDLRREVRERYPFRHIRSGSMQPFLSGVEERLQEDLLLIGDTLVSLRSPYQVVGKGYYWAPFGAPLRMAAQMSGLTHDRARLAAERRGRIKEFLDIGAQDSPSFFGEIRSIYSRRREPSDPRNIYQSLLRGERITRDHIHAMRGILSEEVIPLENEVMKKLQPLISRAYGDLFPGGKVPLQSEKDLTSTLYKIVSARHRDPSKTSKAFGRMMELEWEELASSPASYFRHMSFSRRRLPPIPYSFFPDVVQTPRATRLRYMIQREIVEHLAESVGKDPLELMKEYTSSKSVRRMIVESAFSGTRTPARIANLLRGDSATAREFRRLLQKSINEVSPWYAPGIHPASPSRLMARAGGGGVLMRRWQRPPRVREMIDALQDPEARARVFRDARDFIRQFYAGRHDIEGVTTATLLPYHVMSRLNDMFAEFGLGLSVQKMGSAQQIFTNLLGRRYLAGIALAGYLGYADWEVENLTGFRPRQIVLDTLAGANIAWSYATEAVGIGPLTRRMSEVMPGSEMLWELPVLSALDPRWKPDDLRDFLREGVAPVRSGRFWQFGSTPIQGGAISYYWPSWYRRWSSDWEFTDIMWGERDEAYRTWFLPTPRFPAAPIRHFITEPYHLEERWGRDRPYPMTGPIPIFANIPLLGSRLSATLGRIFKPPTPLFEDEVETWMQEGGLPFEFLPSPYAAAEGVVAEVSPAGLVTASRYLGLPGGYALGDISPDAGGEATAAIPYGPSHLVGEGPGFQLAAAQLRNIHYQMLEDGAAPEGVRVRARFAGAPQYGLDPNTVRHPYDLRLQLGESFSAATDISGLYGFLARTALGVAERPWEDVPRLATPERATSLGRWHRELQIGGFPGELSEVVRRFLPSYRHQDPEVFINPIRNRMPSWMPGSDYFLDYQHGDPYAQIPHGEYRLPGPGFEMMHGLPSPEERLARLVPDPQMRELVMRFMDEHRISPYELYTPWERFMVLADAAPYSSQYEYYSRLLSQHKELVPEGKWSEYQAIKRRVSAYKKRLRFFPYRFRGADLQTETVTVARVLPRGYFTTEEYPTVPFRFAGVSLRTSETGERPEEFLGQFIYPGARVAVSYAKDELRRQGSDQFGSTLAVVRAGGVNLNRLLIERGLARETEATDPAAMHVRFSAAERFIGAMWERLSHLDTPIHCVAPWTQIITKDGIAAAEEVKPGSYVLTHTGQYKKVVDVRPQPAGKRVVEVKLSSSNIPLVVTDDHPILACRHVRKKRILSRRRGIRLEPWDRRDGKAERPGNRLDLPVVADTTPGDDSMGLKIEFVHAGELKPYDYVVYRPREMPDTEPPAIDMANLSPARFSVVGNKVTATFHGGASPANEAMIPRFMAMSPELARLMGYYAAEGCIAKNVSGYHQTIIFVFSSHEKDYANDVARLIRCVFGKDPTIIEQETTLRVQLPSAFAAELMRRFVGEKENKRAPEELLTTRELRAEFIRGVLRGAGAKAAKAPYANIAMVSLNILLWLRDALFHLWRVPAAISLRIHRDQPLYDLRIGACPELADFVDGEGACPNRPFKRDIELRTRVVVGEYIFYRVESITESEYQGRTIDIEVEEDDTFATLNAAVHNTKFIQVRSPLEMYERRDLFGKAWQPWWEPVSSILVPTYQSLIRHNPLVSAGLGYAFGRLFTLASQEKAVGRKAGLIGASILGVSSLIRAAMELSTGETWIPPRRRLERDIDLYFQALEYVKQRGIYEFAARRALEEEGFDVASFFAEAEAQGRGVRYARRALQGIKREMLLLGEENFTVDQLRSIHERLIYLGAASEGKAKHERILQALHEGLIAEGSAEKEAAYKAILRSINQRLLQMGEMRRYERVGPWAQMAIAARQRYESTAFGVDLYGHLGPVMASLSRIERQYFMEFLDAPEFERPRILSLASLPMRRALQARWGMEPDPLPSLEEVFSKHFLPPPTSQIWSPAKNIDDLKLRVVDSVGLELSDFGFWPSDVRRAERHQAPLLPWNNPSFNLVDLKRQIEELLKGQGLEDVWVQMERSSHTGFRVQMDIQRDLNSEWERFVRENQTAVWGAR